MARSARQDDSRSGVERGRRSPQGVEQRRRAGRPAGGRQRVAGSASACSAARDERSGARSAPSPQPVLRRTMPTPSGFASAMPTVERPKDGRAREVGDGLQIGRRAHPAPPAPRMARPQSAGAILAVVGRSLAEHVPRARPRGDVALCPSPRRFRPASIGGERGGGVAVKPGLGRSPQVVAQLQAVGECPAGRLAVANLCLGAQSRRLVTQGGSLLPRNGDSLGQ
jgi:hypothetical protein